MKKQLRKFEAVKFHHFGLNEHAFWNGKNWTLNEDDSVFYNDQDSAAEASKLNGGKGDYVRVCVEF